jgi:hypothetical protein
MIAMTENFFTNAKVRRFYNFRPQSRREITRGLFLWLQCSRISPKFFLRLCGLFFLTAEPQRNNSRFIPLVAVQTHFSEVLFAPLRYVFKPQSRREIRRDLFLWLQCRPISPKFFLRLCGMFLNRRAAEK